MNSTKKKREKKQVCYCTLEKMCPIRRIRVSEQHEKCSCFDAENTSTFSVVQLREEFTDRFGKPSKDIELYMQEKLFEYLASTKGVERIRPTKNHVTFVLSKEASRNVNGEYLFTKANDISKFIRFSYRLNQINIILDTIKLPKHYLYYIVDVLELL